MEKLNLQLTRKQLDTLEEVLSYEIEKCEEVLGVESNDNRISNLQNWIFKVADIRTEVRELN